MQNEDKDSSEDTDIQGLHTANVVHIRSARESLGGFHEGVHAFINKQRYSRGNRDSVMTCLTTREGGLGRGGDGVTKPGKGQVCIQSTDLHAVGKERGSMRVGSGPLC